MYKDAFCYIIVVAGGSGSRFGGDVPKQFVDLCGIPVVFHSLLGFDKNSYVDGMILVAPNNKHNFCRLAAQKLGVAKLIDIVSGGASRQESVYNGLLALPKGNSIVLVHDGARPLVTDDGISAVVSKAHKYGAATLAAPVTDTIKMVNPDMFAEQTVSRQNLYLTQTPQGFRQEILTAAHEAARNTNFIGSDDCQLVEKIGVKPKIIPFTTKNIKITHEGDLQLAELLLKTRV